MANLPGTEQNRIQQCPYCLGFRLMQTKSEQLTGGGTAYFWQCLSCGKSFQSLADNWYPGVATNNQGPPIPGGGGNQENT